MESAGSSTEVTSDTTMINEEEEETNDNNGLQDDDMIAEYDDDEENDDDVDSSDDGNSQKDDDSSSDDDDDSSDGFHPGGQNNIVSAQMRRNSHITGGAVPNSKAQTTSFQKDDNPNSKPRTPQDGLNRKKIMDHDDDMITMYHDNWPKSVAYNRSISWQGRPLSRRTHHTFTNFDNRNSFHASNYTQLGYQPPRKIIEHYDSKNNKRTSKQETRYQEWLDKRKMSDQIRNLQEELDNCDIYGGIGRPDNVIKEEDEPMIRFIPKSQSMKVRKTGDVNNYNGSPSSLTAGYCPTPAHSNQGSRSVSRGSSKKRRKRKKKDCNLM